MIISFVLFGKFLEVIAKNRAIESVGSINSLVPIDATLIEKNSKKIVAVEEIKKGDIVEIVSGDIVPVDGVVISGASSFDYSALTGESLPVSKEQNCELLSGAVNLENVVLLEATKDFEDSTLSKLCRHLEESIASKPEIEKKANLVSGYFSVTILLLSISTLFLWMFFDTFENSLVVAISVIVIACPCALALATPMAVLFGLSVASKNRIIFKEARFLETMAKADTIALDKTGTLTKAELSISNFDILQEFDMSILYSLVLAQTHPVS
jgi:Cu+-exporting ATPase